MANNFRALLFAGTALAVIGCAAPVYAATQTDNLDDGSTVALTMNNAAVFVAPAAGVDEAFTIADGIAVGDVGAVVLSTTAGGVGTLTFLGSSVATGAIGGAANLLGSMNAGVIGKTVAVSGASFINHLAITGADAGGTGTVAFASDLTIGSGGLTVTSPGVTTAAAELLTVGGKLDVTGTTAITASTLVAGGSTSAVTVTGNATFAGLVTLTGGGGNAANTANLTLNGTTNTLTAGAVLDDGVGAAILTFSGSGAQTVLGGEIKGAVAGEGAIVVSNTSGVTFNTLVGSTTSLKSVTIEKAAGSAAATFKNTVSVSGGVIKLGTDGNAGDVNTLTLDGAAQAFTVTGAITGTVVETDNVVVTGGKTITLATATGANLDNVTLTGVGTNLAISNALSATTITVGAGATLTAGAAVTGAVNISGAAGTVALGDAIGLSSTLDNTSGAAGAGILTSADAAGGGVATIVGAVGSTSSLQAVTLTTGGTLAFSSTVKATTISALADGGLLTFADNVTGNVNLGADATVTLASGKSITGAVNNTAGIDDKGTLAVTSNATDTISGAVGATNALKAVTLAGTGIVSFGSTVNAKNVTFNAATAAVFSGNVSSSSGIDFNDQNGVISFGDNASLTGSVIDSSTGKGTVGFSGTSVVIGNLGTGGTGIAAVNFNGGTGEAVSVSGTIAATTVTVGGAGAVTASGNMTGDLNFNADGTLTLGAGKTITGTVDNITGSNGAGTLVFAGGGTLTGTFGATNTLKALTLDGTGTSGTNGIGTLVSAGTIVPNLKAADTMNLNGNTLAVTGTLTVAAGQTINTTVKNALTGGTVLAGGNITATGNAAVNANALVDITLDTTDFIANGATFKIIDGNAGAGVAALVAANITDNSFLLSFVQDAPGGADLVVHVARPLLATVSSTANGDAVGAALDSLGSGGGAEILAIQTNLNTATTAEEVDDILESLVPTVDGGAVAGSLSMGGQRQRVIETRMAALRSGDGMTGMAAGASGGGGSFWAQGYGQGATQELRGDIDGYHSATWGGAIGVDTIEFFDRASVGFAFNYGRTIVRSENANTTLTTLDNIGVNFYSNLDLWRKMFMDAQIGYAYNKIAGERHNVGMLNDTAQADYHSDQYTAKVTFGRDFAATGGMTLTPDMSAAYTYLDTAGYTETEAGGAGLTVEPVAMSALDLGVRLNAAWRLKYAGMGGYGMSSDDMLKPILHVGYYYDVIGDTLQQTSAFGGGGASFVTTGPKPEQGRLNAGAGLSFTTSSDWSLSANYDYDYKIGYGAHNGVVRLISYF